MTQKELLYVEDAIGHEKNIINICKESIKNLENDELVTFLENEITKHQENKENLLNILKEKANG